MGDALRLAGVLSGVERAAELVTGSPCAPARAGTTRAWWAGAGLGRIGVTVEDRLAVTELPAAAGPGGDAYELVFTPSRSTLAFHMALLASDRPVEAAVLEDAHREGVRVALDTLQKQAGWAEPGYLGQILGGRTTGRRVKAAAWTVPVIDHVSGYAADSSLHSHTLVFTETRESGDGPGTPGPWRTLDSRALREALAMGAISYDRAYEYAGARDLGLEYARRSGSDRHEISGISDELIARTLRT